MINVKGSFPVTLAPEKERQTVLWRKKSHSVYVTSDKVKGHPSIAFAPSESQNQ